VKAGRQLIVNPGERGGTRHMMFGRRPIIHCLLLRKKRRRARALRPTQTGREKCP
jgi:hypothetical protein